MALNSLRYFLLGVLLIFIQFFLLKQVAFGTWIIPMPYIYVVLVLPFEMNRFIKLGLAFALGWILDGIGDSYGKHACAMLTLSICREYADQWFLDKDAIQLQGFTCLTPGYKGMAYYFRYAIALIFIHHIVFFMLDYFSFSSIFTALLVSVTSSIATFVFILLYRIVPGNR